MPFEPPDFYLAYTNLLSILHTKCVEHIFLPNSTKQEQKEKLKPYLDLKQNAI
jgi:hypothetical protein